MFYLNNNHNFFFNSITMFRFWQWSGETKVAKEQFYGAKRPMKIEEVNIDNIVISKLVETKTNSQYLIGYLDKVIRPLVLIMPKMSGYVQTFKVKDIKTINWCLPI